MKIFKLLSHKKLDIKALLYICIFCNPVFSQVKLISIDSLYLSSSEIQSFQIDHQGNIYFSDNDRLIKMNQKGDTINMYSNKLLGEISSFDVSLLLKIPVFYRDLSQVVFVDNTISEINETIELDEMGLEQVTLICSSQQGGLWLYDALEFALIKFDKNMNEVSRSSNLTQLFQKEIIPTRLSEQHNKLFLWCNDDEVLVFDLYGGFIKKLHFPKVFMVFGEKVILAEDEDGPFIYDMEDLTESRLDIKNKGEIKHITMHKSMIFVLFGNIIRRYKMTPF